MKALLLAAVWLVSSLHLSPPGGAGPLGDELRRERLPADVDFVVHLDVEGFKQTELWKQVQAASGEHGFETHIEDLAEFKTRYGIDPFTDVRAVTLYKVKNEEDPTVVLFSTTTKVDEALRAFQKEPGYARIVDSGIELHTWPNEDDGKEEKVCAYLHVGKQDERVVVLASNVASAVRAAKVLRGESPNHAQSGSLLTLAPARGSFLYLAAAQIPHLDEFTPASQVFGLAQGIQVDLGEAGGFLRAHMGVTTRSPEDALNISNVINGLVSLVRLAGSEAGEALELLTGLRLNTRGSEVLVDFEFGVNRLLEILKAADGDDDDEEAAKPHAGVEVK
jgi:hypothetical protein